MKVVTGLDRLLAEKTIQDEVKGNITYLCHSASITSNLEIGAGPLKKLYGKRLKSLMGPQHGLISDVQDNMVESGHYIHPYFNIPVHSLYSETRIPTDKMLEGIDTIIIDLQDVGTRIYTYITTMKYTMEKCAKLGKRIVILDRPNPIGGKQIEGNVLEDEFLSFVGASNIPVRHGMTIGEMALFFKEYHGIDCDLTVIPMNDWKREMYFCDTSLPWVLPSPNLPTPESAITFAGTVLFEGTNISEGRGTTRSLEMIGHPKIEPFSFHTRVKKVMDDAGLEGFRLRPCIFTPTFQKHANTPCGGFQIHITDKNTFRPWKVCQMLLREIISELGNDFELKKPPYEYEYDLLPINLINGSEEPLNWAVRGGTILELELLEKLRISEFMDSRDNALLY
ncbi:MAG: DUF1343 domain-containing protein [Bacteriovoracaceae bacterium]|nr:DUF1343 domain-containing protein [Bacteriovoracaceae bacterium]